MIIDFNMVHILVEELNKEIKYKLTENSFINKDTVLLVYQSDAKDHRIYFLGQCIWSSALVERFEDLPVEKDIELHERKLFEQHLRNLIMDQVNIFKNLEV